MSKNNKKIKVSIIILTINSFKLIESLLSDVSKLDINGLDLECIIVDNGSTDGTEDKLKNFKFNNISFKYINTGSNLGFTGGNNIGIKYALKSGAKYCLLLNNDMILQKNLLIKLVSFMNNNPQVGLVSPKIYFAKGYEFYKKILTPDGVKDRYKSYELGKVIWYAGGIIDWNNIYTSHRGVDEVDCGQFDKTTQTNIASGSCVLIRREVFEKIGLLDESLFLYWEDADFSLRAKANGFKIYYYPKTYVWHKVSISAGGSGSFSNDYFLTRNRYYFALRYANLRAKFAVIRDTVKLALVGREWQKKGATDALLGKKGTASWKK